MRDRPSYSEIKHNAWNYQPIVMAVGVSATERHASDLKRRRKGRKANGDGHIRGKIREP